MNKDYAVAVLRNELSKRIEKNPAYSQRSFAKYLGVSHSLLSLVLNGQRPVSRALIEKISERLTFSPKKRNQLLGATAASASSEKNRPSGEHVLSLDQFALMSEWQHYAILSLLELKDTKCTPEFIAKRLGISVLLARISFDRLVKLGVIEKCTNGRWKQKSGPFVMASTNSSAPARKFQRQLMKKAVESLENDPIETRNFSSTTFIMNPKHVPYAIERIRTFRKQLSDELEAFGDANEVYNLTVQIFPTSQIRRSK